MYQKQDHINSPSPFPSPKKSTHKKKKTINLYYITQSAFTHIKPHNTTFNIT